MSDEPLRRRSIRTLAWLGDVEFERETRLRIARRGDWPTKRLDQIRALIVCAEAQARLLERVAACLDEHEEATVRRGRNSAQRRAGRGRRDVKAYRAATGLEALVAHWSLGGSESWKRFDAVLGEEIETAIDEAIEKTAMAPKPDR